MEIERLILTQQLLLGELVQAGRLDHGLENTVALLLIVQNVVVTREVADDLLLHLDCVLLGQVHRLLY